MVPAGRHRATPPASFRRRAHPILTTRPSPTSGRHWLTAAPTRVPQAACSPLQSRPQLFSCVVPPVLWSWSGQPTPRHLPIPAPCRTCVTILTTADSTTSGPTSVYQCRSLVTAEAFQLRRAQIPSGRRSTAAKAFARRAAAHALPSTLTAVLWWPSTHPHRWSEHTTSANTFFSLSNATGPPPRKQRKEIHATRRGLSPTHDHEKRRIPRRSTRYVQCERRSTSSSEQLSTQHADTQWLSAHPYFQRASAAPRAFPRKPACSPHTHPGAPPNTH